jgi:hypothetical protein
MRYGEGRRRGRREGGRRTEEGITLTLADIQRLLPDLLLNDSLVDFWDAGRRRQKQIGGGRRGRRGRREERRLLCFLQFNFPF